MDPSSAAVRAGKKRLDACAPKRWVGLCVDDEWLEQVGAAQGVDAQQAARGGGACAAVAVL